MELTIIILLCLIAIFNLIAFLILWRKSEQQDKQIETLANNIERIETSIRNEIAKTREENSYNAKLQREEIANSLKTFGDSISKNVAEIAHLQKNQLDTFSNQLITLTQMNEQKLETMRGAVLQGLKSIQEDNALKLEQMRATVDEKLHNTLERRLGESFKLVSDRLELVRQGLGEMQTLANGVGDLKKVLTNVKTRGTWGEIQLGNLLEQILAPEQYATNVVTKGGSKEFVEFAVRLPGRNDKVVWLPIDAKFPKENYEKLLEAQEEANPVLVEKLGRDLEDTVKLMAKGVRDKYLNPPNTTDFGILFLATEGLYAEIIRRPGFCDYIQREYRIVVAGPTTIAALLNSLQMGFKSLAIEKRASEVWNLLSAVKTEFGKFGDLLDKTHKQLQTVSITIEDAAKKSRGIEKKLRDVQVLPASSTNELLI